MNKINQYENYTINSLETDEVSGPLKKGTKGGFQNIRN